MQIETLRPHALLRLHQELAALPELAPIPREDGDLEAVFTLSGDGTRLVLEIPDAALTAVLAAVATHDPTPAPASPTLSEQVVADLDAATSLTEVKAALRRYFLALRD